MGKENFQRLLAFKVYEVLRDESDEEHPLSLSDLQELLGQRGYTCDTRTVHSALLALIEGGCDIHREFRYPKYVYCLLGRAFDVAELQILADAVRSATCITEKKSFLLIDKLARLAGRHAAKVLEQKHRVYSVQKSDNENIFRYTDQLHRAIESDRQVSFFYLRNRKPRCLVDGTPKQYFVSPVGTVFNDGAYYLVGESVDHPDRLVCYRVDRMRKLAITEQPRALTRTGRQFSKEQYRHRVFSMYSGAPTRVTLKIREDLIDVVTDSFGRVVPEKPDVDGWYTAEVEVDISPTFFAWCCHFTQGFRIVAPAAVVQQMKQHVEQIAAQYR